MDFMDKLSAFATKLDAKNFKAEADTVDGLLEKMALHSVTVTVKENPNQNEWVGTTSDAQLTISSPIYNPANDRSPENYQRGIATMRSLLAKELATKYPRGTQFIFNPAQFGTVQPKAPQATPEFSMGPATVSNAH